MKSVDTKIEGSSFCYEDDILILSLPHPYLTLSTAIWGGGEGLRSYGINKKLTEYYRKEEDFPGGSVKEYLRLSAEERKIPAEEAAVLLTSATVSYFSHKVIEEENFILEIFATGGVEKTACRASSPALYKEEDGKYTPIGTINMIVATNVHLPAGIMARALITLTEGKCAALQDMGIADVNNGLPATGTATDGITLFSDPKGNPITDAGGFSLFGASLAKIAYDAVSECITLFDMPWNRSPLLQTPKPVNLDSLRK